MVNTSENVNFCPTPAITYNGSVLPSFDGDGAAFKSIKEVEFEVRMGPASEDRRMCKLTCRGGQWVGPRCRRRKGDWKLIMDVIWDDNGSSLLLFRRDLPCPAQKLRAKLSAPKPNPHIPRQGAESRLSRRIYF
jgi:hypothetical protein